MATVVSPWGLVALQGGLVTPKELWWPLWCPVRFGGPTGGFGDPKGALVVAVVSPWGLVALQGSWWPQRSSGGHCGVPVRFGGPTGGLVALQGSWWPYRGVW